MADVYSIALSGLQAQSQRLSTTANNIANVSTAGKVPEDDPAATPSTVYKPLTTQLLTQEGGSGVTSVVSEQNNPYSVIYDPNSIYANEKGNIAVPNVDLTSELVSLKTIEIAYKANIASIKTQDEMHDSLLDIFS